MLVGVLALGTATAAQAHPGIGADEATPVEVTESGALVHVDPIPEGKAVRALATPRRTAAVPLRHSQPGAATRVYLDFDGFTYSNSTWTGTRGTRTISPYAGTTDHMDEIWQRVAEDFAPFDVDITTEEPPPTDLAGPGDGRYGVRVVVGGTPTQAGFSNGIAGVAPWAGQAGTFDDDLTPGAFVFANLFGNDLGFIADTISHETGHVFGAAHDGTGPVCTPNCDTLQSYYTGHGTGPTSWGPLMGSPRTGQITTWSDGTYPNANNTEDDLGLISRWTGLRPDESPDDADVQTAPDLGGTPGAVDQEGLIATRADTDGFRFSAAAGPVSFTVTPRAPGANLDAGLELLDAEGDVVATANDPDGLSATLSATVTAGTYLLRVVGVGDTDPAPGYDDYASLGHYRIQGSHPDATGLAPNVVFTPASRVGGAGPLTVEFDSAATTAGQGTITGRTWRFGDGTTATTVAPSHVYATDGTYTARLTVTNSAGFVAGRAIRVVVDSVAPDTVVTGGPTPGVPSGRTATFTYRDEPRTGTAGFRCALDDAALTDCPAEGRTFEDLADGDHTFTVQARDEAGNLDPTPAVRGFTVDGPPPRPELLTDPVSPANDTTPLLRGQVEPGATAAVFATADCGGDALGFVTDQELFEGLPLTVPANAATSYGVIAVDAGGRESPCASLTYVEDSTAPDTTITGGPVAGSTVATTSATLTYAADPADGDTFSCALDGASPAACPATGTTLTGLADGEHTFTVVAVDRAGNADPTAATRTWTVAAPVPDPTPTPTPTPTATPTPTPTPTATPTPAATPTPTATATPDPPAGNAPVGAAGPPADTGPLASTPVAPDLAAPLPVASPRPGRLAVRPDARRRTATVTFRVPASGRATCALDRGPFRACRSPLTLRRVAAGKHTVRIRVTVGGRRGPTVTRTFQMPRRR